MPRQAHTRVEPAEPPAAVSARRRRTSRTDREPRQLAESAASFTLVNLADARGESARWTDCAASYRASKPAQPPANDPAAAPAAPHVVPFRRQAPHLPRELPVRLMQALDWAATAAAAQFAAMWGAGAGLAELAVADAAAFILSALALKAGLWLTGAYQTDAAGFRPEQGAGGLALGAVLGLALAAWLAPDARSVAALAATLPAAALMLAAAHAALAIFAAAAFRAGAFSDLVVLVGATESARAYAAAARQTGEARIIAVFDDRRTRMVKAGDLASAGTVDQLLSWEGLPQVDRVVIAVTESPSRQRALVQQLAAIPNRVDVLVEGFEGCSTKIVCGRARNHACALLKRMLDVAFGAALLALFAAPMLLIAVLIRIESRGPALTRARAYGRNNAVFGLVKFRTTRMDGVKPAPTRLGGFLKRTRLDDLPQIFNLLAGEMSLIGPRPHLLSRREARRAADYAHRHRVKPGLVGWAHVNGAHGKARSPAAARKRLRFDLDYAARASLMLDLLILGRALGDALGARR